MRGMGWMWDRNTASALPDSGSPGATLESKYCSQCHAAPPPGVHTAKEWADVTARMRDHISDQSKSFGNVIVPSASELTTILDYLDKNAKPGG
jgi:cytochrome c5